ncbi:hypothetical protein [Burkholderia glumae]|uniref:hypothetical protein n=1 Tax=Burkholderia glumae TaxID=337 RepID=UPI000F5D91C3|nr:hypothetical protein [Burkholderia glumae]MCQ0034714.1 hypothetical protein [Burkholderia glumae]MCQ0040407.1 hypothetical protein [Burkholderia glumae]QJW81437.1 hypothetical protein GAS18_22585 [Burkholderia glumae]
MKHNFFLGAMLALVLTACGKDWNLPGGQSGSAAGEKYRVGIMNGVRLKIPESYLDGGFTYEGEPIGGFDTASTAATFDSRVTDFGFLVRLSTLQPMHTNQDHRDWIEAERHTYYPETWMAVDFDNRYPVINDTRPYGSRMLYVTGPYDIDSNKPFGLVHYESILSVDDGEKNNLFRGHTKYFLDNYSSTVIECETHRQRVKPFALFSSCHHRFLVPELNVMTQAFYTKKDLYRWREIESRVKEIAHGFVVH